MHSSDVTAAEQDVPPPQASNRSALLIVFIVVFIDLLGFGIVLPLLPLFARDYVAPLTGVAATEQTRDPLGGLIIGLLMSSFSLMQFLFAPAWGRLSDRIGRRPVLLLGLGGSVIFYGLFGFALSLSPAEMPGLALALLFITRIGAGIAGATIGTAQAVIADSTPPEKRKHGMALIGAAFGIGFTFGPLFAYGALQWFNREAIGYTASGLSLLALLLGLRLLPETRRVDADAAGRRRGHRLGALFSALTSRALGPVILTFFLATLGFGAFEVTLALLLDDVMKFKDDDMFLVFALIGFVLMLTQGFLYRRLAKRVSEATFIAVGLIFMAAGVAGLGGVSWLSVNGTSAGSLLVPLYAALVAAVMGFAFLTPSAQALVSRRSDPNKQGEILGANQSASALARILGPIFGVTLYKATASHMLPYLFGSILLLLMLPLMPRIRKGE